MLICFQPSVPSLSSAIVALSAGELDTLSSHPDVVERLRQQLADLENERKVRIVIITASTQVLDDIPFVH